MTIKLKNIHVADAKTGVKIDGPVHVEAEDIMFDGVETPWDIDSRAYGSIRNSKVHNDPKINRKAESPSSTSLGWRRSKGPPLPVFCPSCGSTFPSRNHVFSGQYWSLWGNEEPCPFCGFEHAQLSEGIFNLANETVEILHAPDATHEMIRALRETAERYFNGALSTEAAIQEISEITPSGVGAIRRSIRAGTKAVAALVAFFAIVNGYADFVENYGIDPVSASIDYVMERVLRALDFTFSEENGSEHDIGQKAEGELRTPPRDEAVPKRPASKFDENDSADI